MLAIRRRRIGRRDVGIEQEPEDSMAMLDKDDGAGASEFDGDVSGDVGAGCKAPRVKAGKEGFLEVFFGA